MIDPEVINKVVSKFLKNSYDYVCNNFEWKNRMWIDSDCNFPKGMVVEICSFKTLKKAYRETKDSYDIEHVFPYVQFNPKIFKVSNVKNGIDLSHIGSTVDTKNDLRFVRAIYKKISRSQKIIQTKDILKIVKGNPNFLNLKKEVKTKLKILILADGDKK